MPKPKAVIDYTRCHPERCDTGVCAAVAECSLVIGLLTSEGKLSIEISTPPEFKDRPGVWTPKTFLIASVDTCVMTTFLYYAEKNKLDLLSYESSARGVLERVKNEGNSKTKDKISFSKRKVKKSEITGR